MRLSKAIEGYKLCKLGEGMSQNTINGYDTHFNQLVDFVGDVELEEISQDQLQSFILYLRRDYKPRRFNGDTSPYRSTTIRNAWCAVRSLFGWAHSEMDIPRPDLSLKMPKVSYPEIQPFTKEEIDKILKASVAAKAMRRDGQNSFRRRNKNANRNRAVVLVLLDTGVRVSECAAFRIKDVNLENGEIYVRPLQSSRKNKSRTLQLGTAATKAVWRYLAERERSIPDDILFLTQDNRPMDRHSIRGMINRIGKSAGVLGCYPHRFRHTYAIQFLRNGGDVFSLQHSLGHTDWAMTRHYANLAQSDFSNTHHRASPVDNWRL